MLLKLIQGIAAKYLGMNHMLLKLIQGIAAMF